MHIKQQLREVRYDISKLGDKLMEYIIITEEHFEALKKLHTAYKAAINEAAPSCEQYGSLFRAIERGDIQFYGCVCDGALIACCSVSRTYSTFNYDSSGVFEDFYIVPEYRHKGIARKLVQFSVEKSGVKSLTVGCAKNDVEMYKAIGFDVELGNMLAFDC